MSIRRNAQGKIIVHKQTLAEIEAADENMQGFCAACGALRDCCEPDARGYTCDDGCGLPHVYGAQEFALRGWIKDDAEPSATHGA